MIEHKHIVVRAEIFYPPAMGDLVFMEGWFKDLVYKLKMKVLAGPLVAYCNTPGNKGFTGVCIIETSHIGCHIWDEQNPALMELDIYTCSALDKQVVFDMIDCFSPKKIEYLVLDRERSIDIIDSGSIEKEEIVNDRCG